MINSHWLQIKYNLITVYLTSLRLVMNHVVIYIIQFIILALYIFYYNLSFWRSQYLALLNLQLQICTSESALAAEYQLNCGSLWINISQLSADQLKVITENFTEVWRCFKLGEFLYLFFKAETCHNTVCKSLWQIWNSDPMFKCLKPVAFDIFTFM